MELTRQPLPLKLLAGHDSPERIALNATREVDGDRSSCGELLRQAQIRVAKACVGAELVVRDDQANRFLASEQRDIEPAGRPELARRLLVDLRIVEDRVDALATPALEYTTGLR